MSTADLVDRVNAPGHLLRRAQQVHTECWSRVVDRVTGPQYAVLVAVAGWPGLEQKRAGELASLDKATAAGIVGRLVSTGWIDRVADPSDRRRRLLELTPAARRDMTALTKAAAEVQQFLLSPLSTPDRESFVDLLARVARIDESGILDQSPDPAVLTMARTPGYLIRRAQQLHTSYWADQVGDLTGPQYAVMAAALDAGVATNAQIGAAASLDSSTTGSIVARLLSQGWLESVDNAEDRRSRPVRATRPARTAIPLLRTPVVRVQRQLLALLDPPERDAFIKQLTLVARLPRQKS